MSVELASLRLSTHEGAITPETVERAQRGEATAQADLLRQLQDTIYRFCLAQLRREDSALDATQETALRVLESLPSFRGDSRIKTWVLGIALNVCREIQRKAAKLPVMEILEEKAEASPDVAEALLQQDSTRQLQKLLEKLTPRQREVLVLRYFEQLSVAQTAEILKVSQGTVKAMTSQSLIKLRQLWKENDE